MIKTHPLTYRLQRRIKTRGAGAVFVPKDFIDLGTRAAVDQALSRLASQGAIRRLSRGVYDSPRENTRLGITLTPPPDDIVRAFATTGASRIQVSGAQAANELGLSTQVPGRLVYLTDGKSRRLHIGNQAIELRHVAPRRLAASSKVSATVIEALRYLGRRSVDAAAIRHLQQTLGARDKAALSKDRLHAPALDATHSGRHHWNRERVIRFTGRISSLTARRTSPYRIFVQRCGWRWVQAQTLTQ